MHSKYMEIICLSRTSVKHTIKQGKLGLAFSHGYYIAIVILDM